MRPREQRGDGAADRPQRKMHKSKKKLQIADAQRNEAAFTPAAPVPLRPVYLPNRPNVHSLKAFSRLQSPTAANP